MTVRNMMMTSRKDLACGLLWVALAWTPGAASLAQAAPAAPKAADAQPAGASSLPGTGSDKPIEVTADESLEWRREEGMYVAKGRARAVQGDVAVTADLLTASMKNKAGQKQDRIVLLTGTGHVAVESGRYKATGSEGSFDAETGMGVLTGEGLQMTSDDMTVTARDALEYWQNTRLAVARGNAEMIRADGTHIKADELVAQMRDSSAKPATGNGAMDVQQVDARGHVHISMPQGMAQCDRASFDPVRNLTQLFGHVRVVRGTTVLIGDVVEMNMATGVSRLVSKSGERVRAFLVPGGPSSGSKTDASAGIDGLLAPIPGQKRPKDAPRP
ncbi:MAG: hypothetical protein IPI58_03210 [Alphaproteobacteria bacterium]|nr:MAG: hypothetical protein IPI58_03210 [Alphaproteobacteria bacterium]